MSLEQLGELALAVAHHRRQHHQPRVLGQREHRVDHLADALRLQRQVVVGAERRAGARVQQAQVVVDLGDRADRRARVVRGGLLLDADRRRQALDHVDVGLVHQLQELARIGRQALDIAPLALGVQRVEGQARLARARQAGDHDQRVLRDVEVDVLQVVRARAADVERSRLLVRRVSAVAPAPRRHGAVLDDLGGGHMAGAGTRNRRPRAAPSAAPVRAPGGTAMQRRSRAGGTAICVPARWRRAARGSGRSVAAQPLQCGGVERRVADGAAGLDPAQAAGLDAQRGVRPAVAPPAHLERIERRGRSLVSVQRPACRLHHARQPGLAAASNGAITACQVGSRSSVCCR